MTVYRYSGRSTEGKFSKGTVTATNKAAAISKLRKQGVNPREIEESKSILHKELSLATSVNSQDFVIFCRQFATLIRAGVSIVESTKILAEQTGSKPLAKALIAVEEEIRSGISFSDASNKFPKVFPPLFVNMIRSGEATGNMDDTLDRMAVYFEKQFNTKKKVQSALTYPLVILFLTVVVALFLLLYLVPSFMEMFNSFDAELPLITKITIAFSDWLKGYWWMMFLLIAVVGIGFSYFYKKNNQFNYGVHYALLKIPVFGTLLQKSAIARMMRTLSSLFSSAVPILQALTIVEKVVGNPVISKVVGESRSSLERGSSLSAPLEKSWIFPPLVTQMTAIGEETGSLDLMLAKIADFYEDDVDRTVDTLKSLIEPLMILFLAAVVGFIVAAIMMPMFSLYEQM